MMMAYDNNGHFDLPAYLLAYVYEDAINPETGALEWTLADAIALAADLKQHDGIEADPQETYEIMMEFDAQDNED